MEELKKLIRIVTIFNTKKISLLDINKALPENKEEELFLNIKKNKYSNDQEAVLDLYESTDKSYRYRMLKSRLKEKLLTQLFFVEDNTRYPRKEEKKCVDLMYRGRVLLIMTEYTISKNLYKKALKIAVQYEFTDLALDCSTNLNFISSQLPDYIDFYKTLEKIKFYTQIKHYETQASEIYYVNKIELQKSVVSQKKTLNKLPLAISQLKQLWKQSNSFNIYYYYYMLNGWFLELTGNFNERIRDIEHCEKLLKDGKINTYRFDSLLNKYLMIYALFRAKKHKKGLKLAPVYLKDFNPYSRNWFAFIETYFLLAMHDGNYELATDIILEVDQNLYFKRLKKKDQESWALYKTYLYFLNPKRNLLNNFNYQQFITSVPEHSKDKLGENIALHILQFLYHLKNKDFDQLYYKEGALRKYLSAYLNDPDSQRSRYFFRLLIIIIRADFNPEKSILKGRKWLDKLKSAPEPGDAYARIEVIPYEKLWELLIEIMKEKPTRT